MKAETLAIERHFRRHAIGYHFWARDLRTDQQIEFGERRPYPIASCFKLAVLDAYFDTNLSVAALDDIVEIAPSEFSPGGGILNLFDSTFHFTVLQLLQLMLVTSDGSATDVLISRLGLDSVNHSLRRSAPDSSVNLNLGDMVRRFQSLPNSSRCKQGLDRREAEELLDTTAAELGSTNGADLAHLALNVMRKEVAVPLRAAFLRCLRVAPFRPRSSLFLCTPKQFGKTGSLGSGYFVNDCGALTDENDFPVVHFGYTSYGWRLPVPVVDVVGGLIGIEVARAFGLPITTTAGFQPDVIESLLYA